MKLKEEIERNDLKQNIMQKIIYRFDYQGVVDIEDTIPSFIDAFRNYFKDYSITSFNFLDSELLNVNDISENLGIPVSEIMKQRIHRFTKNTFGTDELILDIGIYNTILTINCKNYKNNDEYLKFISDYLNFFIKSNEFLSFKRVGIRKIGSKFYREIEKIHDDFEKTYFNFDYSKYGYYNYQNRFEDVFLVKNPFTMINSIKTLQAGYFFDENTKEEYEAFQVVIDFEGYLNDEMILQTKFKKNFQNLLISINNNHLFNLFKLNVTEKFLNENSK